MGDVLRSALLTRSGFSHAFNLRSGGVSLAPFDTFNLGGAVGDDRAHVAENHQQFAHAAGYATGALFEVNQVHGGAVRLVGDEDPSTLRAREADGLIALAGRIAVGIRVADCVPVLLADPATGAVAAVHAGWRGVVSEVLEAAVRGLLQQGADAGNLRAAIFPHIRSCCFEVGDDVADTLRGASPVDGVIDRSRAKPHVDLAAIVQAQLQRLRLASMHIDDVPGCTCCEPARFFSYRRDGKRSGRHLAAIVSHQL